MEERPILFSAPMVRALLDGSKTQTRRVVKPTPGPNQKLQMIVGSSGFHYVMDQTLITYPEFRRIRWDCPYGQPGDQLWVREAWCGEIDVHTSQLIYNEDGNTYKCLYRADGHHVVLDDGDGFTKTNKDGSEASPWKPSIHMPRWASRITLEITDVRVERLQDISEADCIAEGMHPDPCGRPDDDGAGFHRIGTVRGDSFPIARYAVLWESINGPASWDLNPWVWVIEFKRITP